MSLGWPQEKLILTQCELPIDKKNLLTTIYSSEQSPNQSMSMIRS
jgi:hypothetical protein